MKRALASILLCAALSGCISRPVVSVPPARCASLIPASWAEGVEAEPIPDTSGLSEFEQIKAWAKAYIGMGGQLEKANGRTADTVAIIARCETLMNEARAD